VLQQYEQPSEEKRVMGSVLDYVVFKGKNGVPTAIEYWATYYYDRRTIHQNPAATSGIAVI
jgi:hypothetical protein